MNIIPAIFFPGILGVIIFAVAFFKYPRWAIAGLIIAKPIIDLTWDYYMILNITLLKIYVGIFVILGIVVIIRRRVEILQCPINPTWLIFIALNFASIFIISDNIFINKLGFFLRILNGFVALILFASLFDSKKDKKFVLSIFIVAGIFPILLWLIPVLLGNPIFSQDELRRIIGPYHSFSNFKIYAMQTLICCLAFLAVDSKRESETNGVEDRWHHKVSSFLKNSVSLKSVILYLMIIISIIMVYKCYTKSGLVVLGIWFFLWFLLRKKYVLSALIPVVAAAILFINPFAREIRNIFLKETDYIIYNRGEKEELLRGRIGVWENMLNNFQSFGVINKFFGADKSSEPLDNDFLRILWDNGFVGFIVYLILMSQTGYLVIRQYARNKDPVVLLAILVLVMLVLESVGLYASFYPSHQWFTWGMIGFALCSGYAKEAQA